MDGNQWRSVEELETSMACDGYDLRRNENGTYTLNPAVSVSVNGTQFYHFENLPEEQALKETWLMSRHPFGLKTRVGQCVLYRDRMLVLIDQHGTIPSIEVVRALLTERERERVEVTSAGAFPALLFKEPDPSLFEELQKRLGSYFGIGIE